MSSLPDLYETKSPVWYYLHLWERYNNWQQILGKAQSNALHLFYNCYLPYKHLFFCPELHIYIPTVYLQ